MGMFSGIENAKVSKGGVYLEPGPNGSTSRYKLEVDTLKAITSRKKDNCFIAEFKIVESDNLKRVAGSSVSWMANLTKHEMAMGNVKGLMAALYNVPEEEVDEAGLDAAVEEEGKDANPCAGMTVYAEATTIMTKEKNLPFTKVVWFPDEAAHEAQAEEEPGPVKKAAGKK